MTERDTTSNEIGKIEVANVLNAMADLMVNLQTKDLALQNALSSLATHARSYPEMIDLQHVDLLTQTHVDLANFLPTLAAALRGESVDMETLQNKLTLRSLQDTLFAGPEQEGGGFEPGELAMF